MLAAACAPLPAGSNGSAQGPASTQAPQRTLNFPVFREVTNLYPAMNAAGGTAATLRMFNGGLTVTDDQGNVHPELAECRS